LAENLSRSVWIW